MWLAVLATSLLLIVLVAVLLYSRRRGWLPASARPVVSSDTASIRVLSSRRISINTTAYVVEYAEGVYLLTESVRGTATNIVPMQRHEATHEIAGEAL